MNIDDLINFNPILAKAFAQFVARNHPEISGNMRYMVAAAIKAGAEPEKIYAMIKTGRMLTTENMKFLSKDDIKEWQDAGEEYRRLAKRRRRGPESELIST
jgi:predicted transcriptional regulator